MKLHSQSRSRRWITINKNKPHSSDFIRINSPIWIETKQEEMFFNSFYFNNICYNYIQIIL
jgi:hypothetical protein